MTELLLFISTFLAVFALGFQSLNVNNGHYRAAFFTSFLIGGANLALFKLAPNAGGTEIAAYLSGGPIGIVCAMKFHGWFRKRTRKGAV
jgi:hypothetical protein